MKLPIFQSSDDTLSLIQTKWASVLNILLGNPSLQNIILPNVAVINGQTVINHLLGKKLQGWRIVGLNAAATIYDSQSTNPHPELTLILNSNAAATLQLEVF